jgi:hypothetical protein
MHAKILLDSTVVDLGDFRLIDSLKALGANPATRLHPVEMALDASATIRGDAAFGNSSTLGDLLGGLRSKADASCGECAERAKELATYFPVFDVLNQARNVVMAPGWGLVGELAAQRFREWDAYHFGGGSARTPMQWELAANGWIYQTFINKDGGKEGPPPAPNWALVLGHPSVGVVPFDSKGAESNVVGAVEGVGFTTWSFDSVTGERTNEWGISAEGVYQPREDANDWSAGVLVRLSFQGINVVWSQPKVSGKREDVFAVSIDITKLFGEGEGQMKIGCLFGFAKC